MPRMPSLFSKTVALILLLTLVADSPLWAAMAPTPDAHHTVRIAPVFERQALAESLAAMPRFHRGDLKSRLARWISHIPGYHPSVFAMSFFGPVIPPSDRNEDPFEALFESVLSDLHLLHFTPDQLDLAFSLIRNRRLPRETPQGFNDTAAGKEQLARIELDLPQLIQQKLAKGDHTIVIYVNDLGPDAWEAIELLFGVDKVLHETILKMPGYFQRWTVLIFGINRNPEMVKSANLILRENVSGEMRSRLLLKPERERVIMHAFAGDVLNADDLARIVQHEIPAVLEEHGTVSIAAPKADYLVDRHFLRSPTWVKDPRGEYRSLVLTRATVPMHLALILEKFFHMRKVLSAFGKEDSLYIVDSTPLGLSEDHLKDVSVTEDEATLVLMLPGCRLVTVRDLKGDVSIDRLANRATGILEVMDVHLAATMSLSEFQQAILNSAHLVAPKNLEEGRVLWVRPLIKLIFAAVLPIIFVWRQGWGLSLMVLLAWLIAYESIEAGLNGDVPPSFHDFFRAVLRKRAVPFRFSILVLPTPLVRIAFAVSLLFSMSFEKANDLGLSAFIAGSALATAFFKITKVITKHGIWQWKYALLQTKSARTMTKPVALFLAIGYFTFYVVTHPIFEVLLMTLPPIIFLLVWMIQRRLSGHELSESILGSVWKSFLRTEKEEDRYWDGFPAAGTFFVTGILSLLWLPLARHAEIRSYLVNVGISILLLGTSLNFVLISAQIYEELGVPNKKTDIGHLFFMAWIILPRFPNAIEDLEKPEATSRQAILYALLPFAGVPLLIIWYIVHYPNVMIETLRDFYHWIVHVFHLLPVSHKTVPLAIAFLLPRAA